MISTLERIGLTPDKVREALRPHLQLIRSDLIPSSPQSRPALESKIEKQVKLLHKRGESVLQICRALKITKSTVRSIIDPENCGRRRNFVPANKKLSDGQVRTIRRRYDEGEPLKAIAAYYGISVAYVSMIGSRKNRGEVHDI